MIVFYHDDLDGRCAAAIVKQFVDCCCEGRIVLIPATYEHPLPIDRIGPEEEVVLVDFTPSPEVMEQIDNATIAKPVWIDHHQANIDKCQKFEHFYGIRSNTVPSGAALTWQHFFNYLTMPFVVQLVSDYDTWTHHYPESIAFEAGMMIQDSNPESQIWTTLLNKQSVGRDLLGKIISDGECINKYRAAIYKEDLKNFGHPVTFEGLRCLACNASRANSELFNSCSNPEQYDAFIRYIHDGKQFIVSLYQTPNSTHNLAELAQKHGGGGHPGAAGFHCVELPWQVLEGEQDAD